MNSVPPPRAIGSVVPPSWARPDLALRDGGRARVRVATVGDAPRIVRFYRSLSQESLYTRFFSANPNAFERFVLPLDHADRVVLLAEIGDEIVGIAEYAQSSRDPHTAEIAFAVLDRMHEHGLASQLLTRLGEVGRRRGIETFTAEVLVTNHSMMHVFRESRLPLTERLRDGVYTVTLALPR